MQTHPHPPLRKTSLLRFGRRLPLLAALLAGLVVPPIPGRAEYDKTTQSPKPLVTSEAQIPTPERHPEAKPTFSDGKFSFVTVDKKEHKDEHGHEVVTDVTMYIPWDATNVSQQVTLKIGKPDDATGIPVPTTYRVLQIHMHRHGEHTMDGHEYQLEMHCVLTRPVAEENGTDPAPIAVLGFLLVQGEQNKGLDFYFQNLESPKGKVELGHEQDFSSLLPHDKTYFSYHGSLTSPSLGDEPLNQTPILWYVLRNEIHMSNDQYNKYFHAVAEHFRVPQTGNTSKVWLIIPQPLGEQ